MLLTRIWGAFLAVLAVGCLAGMFVLSAANSGEFDDGDREAVHAVTEAGVAALEAEIQASPVHRASGLMAEPRLREAMERPDEEELADDAVPLSQLLAEFSERLRVQTGTDMTVAVVARAGNIVAVNGIAEQYIGGLLASDAYKSVAPTEEALFSMFLGDEIHVVKVTEADAAGRRLVATDAMKLSAESLLRRVLGSKTQAGLVRDGHLVGDVIGDQPVTEELIALAEARAGEVPVAGASKVFMIGKGLDARIGALGRVPGPAGEGPSGAMLAVLSRNTAAAGQKDLAQALGQAVDKGLLGRVNWVVLIGLMLVCGGLAIYLPALEAVGPLRRLKTEFEALATGAQHQVFHERYSGAPGDLARAASVAYDALRGAFLSELEIEDDAEDPDVGRERPRTMRARRLTRAHKKLEEAARPTSGPADALPGRRKRGTGPRPERPSTASRPHPSLVSGRNPAAIEVPPEPETRMPGPSPNPVGLNLQPAPGLLGDPGFPGPAPQRADDYEPAEPITAKAPRVEQLHPQPPPLARPPLPSGSTTVVASRPAMPASTRQPVLSPPRANVEPGRSNPAADPIGQPYVPPNMGADTGPEATADAGQASYRDIFDEFVQVKAACGEPTENLTFDRFAAKLRKNERDLRRKRPGITEVQFNVYVKDGKAALKAKVIK